MIFVKINVDNTIASIHYQPFNEKYGLGMTEDELRLEGILVDSIPEPEQLEGKVPILKYNGTNLFYEYENVTLSPEEQTKQEIELLKSQNAQMLFALVQGGLM